MRDSGEMPTLSTSLGYASAATAYDLSSVNTIGVVDGSWTAPDTIRDNAYRRLSATHWPAHTDGFTVVTSNNQQETSVTTVYKRLVRVVIIDPHPSVDVKESTIYDSKEMLTDLTDQELFFESNIKSLLDKHNEKRVKMVDTEASEKTTTEYLKPAKIRDLKMHVVVIAQF
jgi:hypothetical protein